MDNDIYIESYSNVLWCDSRHELLGMNIHLSDNSIVPYAYRIDGTEDNEGFICQTVKADYLSGKFTEIQECPQWKLDIEKDILCSDIKDKRNTLLSATDYLTNNDYPLSEEQKDEIRQFRQLLRDIPQQSGFPENVVWPIVPDCIKDKVTVEIPS